MAELLLVEAASALGVSVDTIRRRVKRGELHAHADSQGRFLVVLPDAGQMPSAAVQAAEQLLSTAEQVAEQVVEQHLDGAEHAAMQARLEGLRDQLGAAQSEVSFLRDELRRRDDAHAAEVQRREEAHEREREQWHARLQEALAALAMQQRALAAPIDVAPSTPTPAAIEKPQPWWQRWWPWHRSETT